MTLNEQYLVDVIGFNPVERSMLASIFALAARRDPAFVQYDPATTVSGAADIYLVDGENAEAMNEFRTLSKRANLPAVMVGAGVDSMGFTLLPRPLQWARLLQSLEETVAIAANDDEGTLPLGRSLAASSAGKGVAPPPLDEAAARKRALGDTVLVVDDNASVRMFMKAKLAPFNFEVDFAETGEEAVGLTGSREYACVFLDVVLPGIDGYQVCKLIKGNKQAIKKTAVVMLTSRSSPFDKLRGSLAGCDEYLTKPLDEDRLLEVIAKFLPSSRKRTRSK
ncbi:MAG: response regulator [Ramlibacter sp.]|uniref:response regulator n=1 Tax=Ramlibacter sp. TaxID=1917967 RepID=UPI002631E70F|nr:response regulator [Ramlibacter sp.]MDB5750547.1 response regulator [Ramlibacter sp.]